MRKLVRSIITALLIIALSQSPGARPPMEVGQPEAPRALVGAYDSAHLNGIVFITNDQNVFGLRFLTYRPGVAVEETPRSYEFGPYAPDGSYAQLSWRSRFDDKTPVTLQWSRVSNNVVVGRLSAPPNTRVAIEAYRPWSDLRGDVGWASFSTQEDRRTIFGEQVNNQKTSPPLRNFLLRADRAATGAAGYSDSQSMRRTLVKEGAAQQSDPRREDREVNRFAALSFDSSQSSLSSFAGAVNSVGFVAMIGGDFNAMEAEADKLLQRTVAEILDQQEVSYENSRATSGGALGASFTALSRTLNWSRAYLPERQLEYVAASRRNDHDTRNAVLSWDTFFNAAVSSLITDASAAATMRLLLEVQAPDGRAPLRRYLHSPRRDEAAVTAGRSMPPIGALCVWKVYLTTRDLGLLAWAYPRLRRWNDWWFTNRGDGQAWRDGNGDGLLEWGFDAELEHGQLGARTMSNAVKQRLAFSESGLEDRPQWLNSLSMTSGAPGTVDSNQPDSQPPPSDEARYNDNAHTLEYSPVGLNALYALDTEILMMMARELGLLVESDKWQIRYEQIRKNIDKKLWSEEDGLYLNRHWDGRYSRRLSPENFYPLVAGLADEEKAKRMMTTLLDSKKFWGEHPLPSISRDDVAFAEKVTGRGAVWAPMNYLIYLGLKRYGYHNEAAELARKNLSIARAALEKSGKFYDQYSSIDGRPVNEKSDEEGDGQKAYFVGLMVWPAVEELLSADPWAGLSFGSVSATEESRLERISFSGVKFDVIAGPKRTVIRRNGKIEIECEAPVGLRAFLTGDRAIGFTIETRERTQILAPASEGRKITVSVDDKVLGSTSAGAAASFKVSAGIHKVLIVK